MASNYTCRACSRALSRQPTPLLQATRSSPKITTFRRTESARSLSTTAPSAYHASTSLSAAQPAPPTISQPAEPSGKSMSTRSQIHAIQQGLDAQRSPLRRIAAKIQEKAPLMTETYVAYAATQQLIKECTRHADYTIPQALEKNEEIPRDETGAHLGVSDSWWFKELGLAPTFINWAQITFIHTYLLQVRFRMFPKTHAPLWIQHLTNHAFYAAEDRLVVWHKLNANSLRQKYLKDVFSQWRAVLLSYDEGIVKGDAVLATAVWRNVFASREDVDFEKLAQIVGYMRRELARLDQASDDDVANGTWKFSAGPVEEEKVVKVQAKSMAGEMRA